MWEDEFSKIPFFSSCVPFPLSPSLLSFLLSSLLPSHPPSLLQISITVGDRHHALFGERAGKKAVVALMIVLMMI